MITQQAGLKFHRQSTCWLAGPVFHVTYTELFSLRALGASCPQAIKILLSCPGVCSWNVFEFHLSQRNIGFHVSHRNTR